MYDTTYDTGAAAAGAGFSMGYSLFWLIILVVTLVAFWKIFVKAGRPGWAGIVPIYNVYILQQIVGRPVWWIVLYFIPVVSLVAWIINALDLGKSFGKSTLFSVVGLILFPYVGLTILGFNKDKYIGPKPAVAIPDPVTSA